MDVPELTVSQLCDFGLPCDLIFNLHNVSNLAIKLSLVPSDSYLQTLHSQWW